MARTQITDGLTARGMFTRVLGLKPKNTESNEGLIAPLREVLAAFGHPEREVRDDGQILYWNFKLGCGERRYFACRCPVPLKTTINGDLTVRVGSNVQGRAARRFWLWFCDRHLAVTNSVEAPLFFIGSGPICFLNRLTVKNSKVTQTSQGTQRTAA